MRRGQGGRGESSERQGVGRAKAWLDRKTGALDTTDGLGVRRDPEIIKLRNVSTVSEGTRRHGLGWFDMDVLKRAGRAFLELGPLRCLADVESILANRFVRES
jgi:hypothetical protein